MRCRMCRARRRSGTRRRSSFSFISMAKTIPPRFATSTDGITFEYGGVAISPALIDPRHHRGLVFTRGALCVAGHGWALHHDGDDQHPRELRADPIGVRNVHLAWSPDGRRWQVRPDALLTPPPPECDQTRRRVLFPLA